MIEVRNLLPHTDKRPAGYRVYPEAPPNINDIRIESGMEAIKLALVCSAGILIGALVIFAIWG